MILFESDFTLRDNAGNLLAPLPRFKLSLDTPAKQLILSATNVEGNPGADIPFEWDGAAPAPLNAPLEASDLGTVLILRITDPDTKACFAKGICGLNFGSAPNLSEVRITLRPMGKDRRWTLAAPFLMIELCWDLAAAADGDIKLQAGGVVEAGAETQVPICTALAIVNPPSGFSGMPDIFVKIDVEPFTLSTGWIPLDLIELPDWSLPDIGGLLAMRGIAAWFLGILDVDLPGLGIDLTLPDWDIDFPKLPKLPFGARFREEKFSLTRSDDGHWKINCILRGIELTVGGIDLAYHAFEMAILAQEDGSYRIKAGLAQLQYPRNAQETKPLSIGLPFGLLRIEASCWLFRVGLHATGQVGGPSSKRRFCIDTVLEIGGGKLLSSLTKKPLWEGDIRLHLRDLTVMTAKYPQDQQPVFLAQVDTANGELSKFFEEFQQLLPAMSIAEKLPRQQNGEVNEFGVSLLGADFRGSERVYLAWKQRGNQLFKALAHELLGTEAAGAIPADTDTVYVGVEVARGGMLGKGRSQIRVDWSTGNAKLPTAPDDPPATRIVGNCIDSNALISGVHLPFGEQGANLDNLVVPNAATLTLPGLRLRVARPSVHSLVFREEGGDSRSISYLLIWDENEAPQAPLALAAAEIGFSFADAEGGQDRQVAEAEGESQSKPFLTAALSQTKESQAIRVFGLRHRKDPEGKDRFDAPKFLKVFAPKDGRRLPSLIPQESAPLHVDDCPPPPNPLPPLAPLAFDDFESPNIRDANSDWRLSLKLGLPEALLNLFGGNGQSVSFDIDKLCLADDGALDVHTTITFRIETFELTGTVVFAFDLDDLALSIRDGTGIELRRGVAQTPPPWARKLRLAGKITDYLYVDDVPDLLGLKMKAIRRKVPGVVDTAQPKEATLLCAEIKDGKFTLRVPEDSELLLRIDDAGDDGLSFRVRSFVLGPGGLDCEAEMLPTTLKLPGLKKPFALEYAKLVVSSSVVQTVRVEGSGQMPELFNSAPVSIGFEIRQDPETRRVKLRNFTCELGDGKAPVLSRGVRLRFDLDKVRLHYSDGEGDQPRVFRFLVTGSLTFVPEAGEFAGSLLETFRDLSLSFTDAPVSDEFFDHVELMATLDVPVEREVFSIFRIQIRSIGFHPGFEFEGGGGKRTAALIIGGQIEFADIGDVASVEIDFHRIYLGFPKDGEVLPQVHAKGLRVEISSAGAKIGGRVDQFDEDLITGFKGEGMVQIPGLPALSAALAFTRIRKTVNDPWKRAWFIAVEGAGISYQIVPLPLYLRQIGLGFGYRFTSPLIRTFEEEDDLPTLIQKMLEGIRRHQTLARIDSWVEDPEGEGATPRWSVGFETVFSMASANSDPLRYQKDAEIKLKSAVAQILAFLRSDLTFLAAAKVWFPISYDDFIEDREGMRKRPLASGFMGYSPRKNRLLIHAASGKDPYLGPENDPVPKQLRPVFNQVHFEATFLSEPGLVHAELGWPDRLIFPLRYGALSLECRGGVLFRLERDTLIQGIYFSAQATLSFSGGVSAGCVGVTVTATARFSAAVRLMVALYLARPLQSNIYAALGVDISVRFELRAWLRIKMRFFTLRLSISFSFELQIVVAMELGWAGGAEFGFKAQARVHVSVFGRGLAVRVSASLFGEKVDKAAERLRPYMSSFLEPGAIPPIPGIDPIFHTEALASVSAPKAAPVMRQLGPKPATSRTSDRTLERLSRNAAADPGGPFIGGGYAAAAAPKAATPIAERNFNLAVVEGTSRRRWYGWITPNVNQANFFPVPTKEGHYATLTLPKGVNAGSVYTLNEDREWFTADNQERLLYFHLGPDVGVEEPNPEGSAASPKQMTLRDLLAASHVPVDPSDDDKLPFDYKDFPLVPPLPFLFDTDDTVRDNRLVDPASEVRNPKRRLDPQDPYDACVLEAMEKTPDAAFWTGDRPAGDPLGTNAMTDQAQGNQSLLMASFLEDLKTLAAGDKGQNGPTPIDALPEDRPTLADLGLLICVEAETCPAWLCTRPIDNRDAVERPTIAFVETHDVRRVRRASGSDNGLDLTESYDFTAPQPLWPAIDFDDADFETNSPVLHDVVSFFDDDSLNLGWTLAWRRAAPSADLFGGAVQDPEDLLDYYDVSITVTGESEPVRSLRALPGDLMATDEDGRQRRVKTRYQVNVALADLPQLREVSLSRRASVIVNVTPVAQTGKIGATQVIEVAHEASTAPLPADDATLDLSFDASAGLSGRLRWRVPSPPTAPGVVPAQRWELVLRPLVELPLGAYPADAVESGESGLVGAGAYSLRQGDVVIALNLTNAGLFTRSRDERRAGDARDPALEVIALDLTAPLTTNEELKGLGDFYAHRGARVELPVSPDVPVHPVIEAAESFFGKIPVTENGGRGWRLFLRAHGRSLSDSALPRQGYSGLVPVTLRMVSEAPEKRPGIAAAQPDTPTRLLSHLEWARRDSSPIVLPSKALREDHGPLLRPGFAVKLWDDGNGARPPWEDHIGDLQLRYHSDDVRERGVTLHWKATHDEWPYAASAAFEIFETRIDHVLAQDWDDAARRDPTPDFKPRWDRVRSIAPIDRQDMGRAVTDFSRPETWWTKAPAETAREAWDDRRRSLIDAGTVPPHPGDGSRLARWWSWSESELAWPDLAEAAEKALEAKSGELEVAPIETIRRVATAAPADKDHLAYLAACRDLGRYLVGQTAHPYLLLLVGQLAARGAPTEQSGLEPSSGQVPRYEVEAHVGQAGGNEGEDTTSPLEWLFSLPEAADPRGWSILAGLGLAVTVSLRDAVTRETLLQETLRDEIHGAIADLAELLKQAVTQDQSFGNLAKIAECHLGVDLPIHPTHALTASPARRKLDDAALSMLQIVLRPQPCKPANVTRHVAYEMVKISAMPSRNVTPSVTMELAFPDQATAPLRLDAKTEIDLRPYVDVGDIVIARYIGNNDNALARMLDGFSEIYDIQERLIRPPSFTTPLAPAIYSPFGHFTARPLVEGADATLAFNVLKDHLVRRPRPHNAAFGAVSQDDLLAAVENGKLYAATARFFVAGIPVDFDLALPDGHNRPLPDATARPFHPLRVMLAAPEERDPQALSPDRQGWFSYTHRIKEEWATLRGYAVRALPRDWAFNPRSRLPATVLLDARNRRIDVRFERIRAIEPPKPLGVRVVGPEEHAMQEVIISEPLERALSRAGSTMAAKLEFQDLRYRPEAIFAHHEWHKRLKDKGIVEEIEERRNETGSDDALSEHLPVLAEDDITLLPFAPSARFGATILRFTAEPFYFRQAVTLVIRAGRDRQSEETRLELPSPRPMQPVPLDSGVGAPSKVDKAVIAWDDLDGPTFPRRLAGMKLRWTEAAMRIGSIDDDIKEAAAPVGYDYVIRAPQYCESLPLAARDAHFSAELAENAPGRLPDCGVRIELVEQTRGVRRSVAMISPETVDGPGPYILSASSSAHHLTPLLIKPSGSGWNAGVLLQTKVVPEPTETLIDLTGVDARRFNVPRRLVAATETRPLPGDLQLGGRLKQWLPFTLRLQPRNRPGGGFLGRLPPQRWALDPTLPRDDDAKPTSADVAKAFRVVLSVQHRLALNLAAIAEADTPPDTDSFFNVVYGSDFVFVTPPTDAKTDRLDGLVNPYGDSIRLFLHKPWPSDETGRRWFEIGKEGDTAKEIADRPYLSTDVQPTEDRVIIVVPDCSKLDARKRLYLGRIVRRLLVSYPVGSLMGGLSDLVEAYSLLHKCCESVARDLMAVEPPAQLKIYAHQGNLPPVPWEGPQHTLDADTEDKA